jgi:hypothetical protein
MKLICFLYRLGILKASTLEFGDWVFCGGLVTVMSCHYWSLNFRHAGFRYKRACGGNTEIVLCT